MAKKQSYPSKSAAKPGAHPLQPTYSINFFEKLLGKYSADHLRQENCAAGRYVDQLNGLNGHAQQKIGEYSAVLQQKNSEYGEMKNQLQDDSLPYRKKDSLLGKAQEKAREIELTRSIIERYKTLESRLNYLGGIEMDDWLPNENNEMKLLHESIMHSQQLSESTYCQNPVLRVIQGVGKKLGLIRKTGDLRYLPNALDSLYAARVDAEEKYVSLQSLQLELNTHIHYLETKLEAVNSSKGSTCDNIQPGKQLNVFREYVFVQRELDARQFEYLRCESEIGKAVKLRNSLDEKILAVRTKHQLAYKRG